MENVYKSIQLGHDRCQHQQRFAPALKEVVEIETINRKGWFSYVLNAYFKDEETKDAWESKFTPFDETFEKFK
jgi:hypothetical protein